MNYPVMKELLPYLGSNKLSFEGQTLLEEADSCLELTMFQMLLCANLNSRMPNGVENYPAL